MARTIINSYTIEVVYHRPPFSGTPQPMVESLAGLVPVVRNGDTAQEAVAITGSRRPRALRLSRGAALNDPWNISTPSIRA